ncbi:hypothetical protein [Lentzea sp. NPDC004782]|uniref:hypothetical protein n=1 Tax=Lentzea sp. NPDC004782 TaxID=3154458 RepID=UPI0033B15C94
MSQRLDGEPIHRLSPAKTSSGGRRFTSPPPSFTDSSEPCEGMLPSGAAHFSASVRDALFRQPVFCCPDGAAPTGVMLVENFFSARTEKEFKLSEAARSVNRTGDRHR